eukprot:SAG31_NODE_40135_length_283_cov_0.559783_1_plen_21_part_01
MPVIWSAKKLLAIAVLDLLAF